MPVRKSTGRYGTLICTRSDRLQKIGSCIALVGVPLSIMGLVFTVVAYGSSDEKDRVAAFSVAGPLLVIFSVLCFLIGYIMFKMTVENLASCYSYFPETQSNTGLCYCVMCVCCKIVSYKTSRGSNLSSPLEISSNSQQPKSILHHSHVHRGGNKLLTNHVRFGGQSEEDLAQRSLSLTSLQRHYRVHPSSSDSESSTAQDHVELPSIVSFYQQYDHPADRRPTSASDVNPVVRGSDDSLAHLSVL